MAIRFLFFDLGNVLLNFSHRRAAEQMAAVSGVPVETVWQVVFEDGLEQRFESGAINNQQFYQQYCEGIGAKPDYHSLLQAGSEIFEVNAPIIPLVSQLRAAGHHMGILSNTCQPHWTYCSDGRFGIVGKIFDCFVLSHEIGVCKPDAKIYDAAAKMAGVASQEIFFADDIPSHVAAAQAAGWDAVQYTSVPALANELRLRGIRTNY